jgi:acetyl esterase/lipase
MLPFFCISGRHIASISSYSLAHLGRAGCHCDRELDRRLVESGVPVVNIIYPLTNHAFDLLLPQISPAAQSALYALEWFLALIV